ncbi:MAG: hypothetical protein U0R67_05015 [Micropruina glycogenica]
MNSVDVARTAADTSDPLAGLNAVASMRRLADMLELQQVEAALRAGHGWPDIATASGYPPSGAQEVRPTSGGRTARKEAR